METEVKSLKNIAKNIVKSTSKTETTEEKDTMKTETIHFDINPRAFSIKSLVSIAKTAKAAAKTAKAIASETKNAVVLYAKDVKAEYKKTLADKELESAVRSNAKFDIVLESVDRFIEAKGTGNKVASVVVNKIMYDARVDARVWLHMHEYAVASAAFKPVAKRVWNGVKAIAKGIKCGVVSAYHFIRRDMVEITDDYTDTDTNGAHMVDVVRKMSRKDAIAQGFATAIR
jgi:hypothetical protein